MLCRDAHIDAVADSNAPSDIAFQLRQLFQIQSQDEDEDVSCGDPQGGMSVADKMDMWASKPQDLETTSTASERFQGILDDPNDGRTILQSKAYEWFVQRLLKESSSYWAHGPQMSVVRKIRHDILRGLPAERFGKGRDPNIHRAEFTIFSSQLRRRLLWDWKDLPAMAVLVRSPDDCLLATSVGEYIDQTWGDNRGLLREFQAALKRGHDFGKALSLWRAVLGARRTGPEYGANALGT